ncbi:hypothetical protein [Marinobacter alexandrii]|jgi:hypothetical protein|uniref:hypothetical protein n=1 Tax=Marinobacter alexandrii TaxID=2570351 RepID=UPI002ABD7CBD|nr:hypothetical protein [Marinobacter alexandrii]
MRRSLLAILLIFVCPLSAALGDVSESSFHLECNGIKPIDVPDFKKLAEESASVNRKLCEALLNPFEGGSRSALIASEAQRRRSLLHFAKISRAQAIRIENVVSIENFERPFTHLKEKLNQGDINSLALPGFSVDRDTDGSFIFHFNERSKSARIHMVDNDACKAKFEVTCEELLKEYRRAFIQYKSAYSKLTTQRALDQIEVLSQNWRDFILSARSQTLWDLGLTTKLESAHFKQGYLVGPPRKQWFFLHPNVIYEHLSDAPDGFQTKPGIALEVIGINYWRKGDSPFYWPFGVSLTSSFVDRPESDDVGIGLMFHVDNRYSLGASHYGGGKTGFFLTIDLLNAINDKRKFFEGYRDQMLD